MTDLQAVLLGIVQGLTEFLPISSSGHLVLVQKLLGLSANSLMFTTFLHVGTLLAVIWAMNRESKRWLRQPLDRRGRMLLVAVVPTAVIGAVCEELFEHLFESGVTVGFEFFLTGVILWWIDTLPDGDKTEEDMSVTDALWIGTLQGVAIMPALSRSGLTIGGAVWRRLNRDAAGRFSFLLSIPAIFGATLVQLEALLDSDGGQNGVSWRPVFYGTLAAVIAGYISVKGTLWLLRHCKFRVFAVYTWAVAAFILFDQLYLHRWFPALWG